MQLLLEYIGITQHEADFIEDLLDRFKIEPNATDTNIFDINYNSSGTIANEIIEHIFKTIEDNFCSGDDNEEYLRLRFSYEITGTQSRLLIDRQEVCNYDELYNQLNETVEVYKVSVQNKGILVGVPTYLDIALTEKLDKYSIEYKHVTTSTLFEEDYYLFLYNEDTFMQEMDSDL